MSNAFICLATVVEIMTASFCLIAAVGIGGTGAVLLLRKKDLTRRFFFIGPLVVLGYFFLVMGLPFFGFAGEALIVFVAGGALIFPLRLGLGISLKGREITLRDGITAGVCFLITCFVLMFTLLPRINYAVQLNWRCDGKILERTTTPSNHNVPTLVVESAGGPVRFENVDAALWKEAKSGQQLAKSGGSPTALLDGQRVRIVPRALPWWNDPP